ncbi:hypothetical protein F5Y10DRAFT_54572 [Nemania abortiva]|nr:hypothetical protein F5Y10DRAFT_54572 [Nemania abortiva]
MLFLSRVLQQLRPRAPLRIGLNRYPHKQYYSTCSLDEPLALTNPGFPRIARDMGVEEETFPDYLAERYYPVRIGEVFKIWYRVVGKPGWGIFPTVWLARDLSQHSHVALRVFIYSQAPASHVNNETAIYSHFNF